MTRKKFKNDFSSPKEVEQWIEFNYRQSLSTDKQVLFALLELLRNLSFWEED